MTTCNASWRQHWSSSKFQRALAVTFDGFKRHSSPGQSAEAAVQKRFGVQL